MRESRGKMEGRKDWKSVGGECSNQVKGVLGMLAEEPWTSAAFNCVYIVINASFSLGKHSNHSLLQNDTHRKQASLLVQEKTWMSG